MAEHEHEPSSFEPSFVVNDQTELESIKSDSLRRRIERLHDAAKTPGLFSRSDWTDEYRHLMHSADEDKYPEDHAVINTFLKNMNKGIMLMDNHASGRGVGRSSSVEESLEELVSLERATLETMKRGIKQFIQGVTQRAYVNPQDYDRSLPPWFEELGDRDPRLQRALRNLLHVNYLAAVKAATGMTTTEEWDKLGVRIEDESLADMMEIIPGFRFALATMTGDIFDKYKRDDNGKILREHGIPIPQDHFVISGNPEKKSDGVIATGGYAIVGSERALNAYKAELTQKIAAVLEAQDNNFELLRVFRVDNYQLLASVAVNGVDSLFFGTGAYDSGDEKRAIRPGDANVYSEAIRTFFMPGIKGKKAKWTPEWLFDPVKAAKKREQGIREEDIPGPLARWIRDNAAVNRDGFRDKLLRGEVGLVPDRLYYSLMDHETFEADSPTPYAGKTLSQALLISGKTEIAPGVWDFVERENAIPFKDLPFELVGDYADGRSAALKIFKHIVSDKAEDRLNTDQLANALIKLRKDGMVNSIYRDEELIKACCIMAMSPNGLIPNITEMVLAIPDITYDSDVYDVLIEDRIFEGMAPDFKDRLIEDLHADPYNAPMLIGLTDLISRIKDPSKNRGMLRKKAEKNLKEKA